MTFCMITFRMMIFGMLTFTMKIKKTQHSAVMILNIIRPIILLSVNVLCAMLFYCYAECHCAQCHFAKCRGTFYFYFFIHPAIYLLTCQAQFIEREVETCFLFLVAKNVIVTLRLGRLQTPSYKYFATIDFTNLVYFVGFICEDTLTQ